MKMTVEEALLHAGILYPERLEERALEGLPHYMWMQGRGKEKWGVCSYCHEIAQRREELERYQYMGGADPYLDEMEIDPFSHPGWYKNDSGGLVDCEAKHGHMGYCPHCGRLITYRDTWRGHSALIDRIFLCEYRKSAVEEDTLVMIGYLAEGSWDKDLLHNEMTVHGFTPDLTIEAKEICIFRYGKGAARFVRDHYWTADYCKDKDGRLIARNFRRVDVGWVQRAEVNSNYKPNGCYSSTPFLRHREDTRDAIEGTSFERVLALADFEQNCHGISMIDWMKEIARYPALEYLGKLGMERLMRGALDGQHKRLLNLRGKTAASVLKITADDWGWLKGHGKTPDAGFLQICQAIRKNKLRLGTEAIWRISRLAMAEDIDGIILKSADAGHAAKAIRYILNKKISARDYDDHLRMLQRLEADMTDSALLYPQDFQDMHGRMAMREKVLTDRAEEKKLDSFLKKLKGFRFSACGLVLAPIATLADVVREGNALSHCVGSYAGRYANGGCILCTLREETALDKPLYTVEFRPDGRMIQCRGYKNHGYPGYEERLRLFWRLFAMVQAQEALENKRKRRRAA